MAAMRDNSGMLRDVLDVIPDADHDAVLADLQQTNSVLETINRFFEGLVVPRSPLLPLKPAKVVVDSSSSSQPNPDDVPQPPVLLLSPLHQMSSPPPLPPPIKTSFPMATSTRPRLLRSDDEDDDDSDPDETITHRQQDQHQPATHPADDTPPPSPFQSAPTIIKAPQRRRSTEGLSDRDDSDSSPPILPQAWKGKGRAFSTMTDDNGGKDSRQLAQDAAFRKHKQDDDVFDFVVDDENIWERFTQRASAVQALSKLRPAYEVVESDNDDDDDAKADNGDDKDFLPLPSHALAKASVADLSHMPILSARASSYAATTNEKLQMTKRRKADSEDEGDQLDSSTRTDDSPAVPPPKKRARSTTKKTILTSEENEHQQAQKKLEQLERKQQQQELAAKRKAERERAALAKKEQQQRDKLNRATVLAMTKNKTTEQCMKEMIVKVDATLLAQPGGAELLMTLQAAQYTIQIVPQAITGSITLRRRCVKPKMNGSSQTIEEDVDEIDENWVILLVQAKDLLAEPIRISQLIRQNRLQLQRGVDAIARGKTSPPFFDLNGAMKSEEQINAELVRLQMSGQCCIMQVGNATKAHATIARLLETIAEAPHRRKQRDIDFYTEARSGTAADSWLYSLELIQGVTPPVAKAIARKYPSLSDLLAAYGAAPSVEDAQSLLADIVVDRMTAANSNGRRIGPALSTRVHMIFTSHDPDAIVS